MELTRPEPKESQVLKAVLRTLELHPLVSRAWRVNSGAGKLSYGNGKTSQFMKFGFPGCPDIHGYLVDGRALYVEVKRPSGTIDTLQAEFITAAQKNGCVAFVARRIEDVLAALGGA